MAVCALALDGGGEEEGAEWTDDERGGQEAKERIARMAHDDGVEAAVTKSWLQLRSSEGTTDAEAAEVCAEREEEKLNSEAFARRQAHLVKTERKLALIAFGVALLVAFIVFFIVSAAWKILMFSPLHPRDRRERTITTMRTFRRQT